MATFKLDFPVYTLDRRVLLPAGTSLTEEIMEGLIASGRERQAPSLSLLDFGTVRRDLANFLLHDPYRGIFDDPRKNASVLNVMEKVRLSRPMLESLVYFQQKDPYTYRHLLIVFALSVLVAMDLEENFQDMLLEATAGPLHDIGKTCVPLPVLKKSVPLTKSERAFLEHHTLAGYVLLSHYQKGSVRFAAKVALEHHERRDGSGYPLGIPLSDRLVEIIAACDVYDALLSPRPYRIAPYDNRTALEEISEMGNQGRISWDIAKALVAHNRRDKPPLTECAVSLKKRGKPPEGNMYGVMEDEG